MTIELFARRLGTSLFLGGAGLIVAAILCWASTGGVGEVVHSIHVLVGWVFFLFGTIMTTTGLALLVGPPKDTMHRDAGV